MQTKVLRTDTPAQREQAVKEAAALLRQGQIVGIPTETVYGLGANALDERAVASIFVAKGRPQNNPLIVHIADFSALSEVVSSVDDVRRRLTERFWPGPLTVIFPKGEKIPLTVTAGLSTVAVRMPSHPLARDIIREAGVPVAAPSANLSGKPSTTTASHVFADLNGKIPLIVDGGSCDVGVESTVVSVKENTVTVLRPGGITVEMLREALPDADVTVSDAVLHPLKAGEQAPSPGMMYKHYAPNAKVLLCEGTKEKIAAFADTFQGKNAVFIGDASACAAVRIDTFPFADGADEAKQIFDDLRLADEKGYDFVIVAEADCKGIGLAINNRLLRAAGFDVISL